MIFRKQAEKDFRVKDVASAQMLTKIRMGEHLPGNSVLVRRRGEN